MNLDLSIVIVTYNCKPYILECMKSILEKSGSISKEIIIVDNASKDGTVEAILSAYPEVKVIRNETNRFLRPAVNQGIRESHGRYVLWLNPDTALLTPGGFAKMVAYMDAHPRVGILGAKLMDQDGAIQLDCERFPGLLWAFCHAFLIHHFFPNNPVFRCWRYSDWDRKDTRAVDSVSGACMLIRREVIEKIGLLEESCLMYWEEPELCRGARKAGWEVVHFAEVEVLHHWMKGGIGLVPSKQVGEMMEKSTLYYYQKFYGNFVAGAIDFLFSVRKFASRLLKPRALNTNH